MIRLHAHPIAALLSAALFALAACDTAVAGDDDDSPDAAAPAPDAEISPSCQEAVDHSDLAWIQDNVFTPSCAAFSSCHQGAAPSAAGLNLEAGNAEANLVGRLASSRGIEDMGLVVVTAGDSSASYLMVLIDHESQGGRVAGPLPNVGTMPVNNPLICVQKRDAIARWIDSL